MKRRYAFDDAPRCTATSKRTGERCEAPAVKGFRVCRFHGARGGGPKGEQNGSFRHGLYTAEAIALRREIRGLLQTARAGVEAVREGTRSRNGGAKPSDASRGTFETVPDIVDASEAVLASALCPTLHAPGSVTSYVELC